MYLSLVPEAKKMVYLITNKFDEDNEVTGDLFREEYERDAIIEPIEITVNKFVDWLKQMNLFDLYAKNWVCKK